MNKSAHPLTNLLLVIYHSVFYFMRNGSCLAALPHSPDTQWTWVIVVTCREWSVLSRSSCSSFNLAAVPSAASLMSFLLVLESVLEGCPVPGLWYSMFSTSSWWPSLWSMPHLMLLYSSPDLCVCTVRLCTCFVSSSAVGWNQADVKNTEAADLYLVFFTIATLVYDNYFGT